MDDKISPLAIWPHHALDGWSGLGPPSVVVPVLANGEQALFDTYHTDVHAVGYVVPDEKQQPRVNKGALPTLRASGKMPQMHWVFLDFDNEGHLPWSSDQEASVMFLATLAMLPNAGGYTTKHGFRVVWKLAEPIPVDRWSSFWDQLVAWVKDTCGETPDPACKDWTRCYRLPNVTRDDVPQQTAESRPPGVLQWTPPRPITPDILYTPATRQEGPKPNGKMLPEDLPLLEALDKGLAKRLIKGQPLAREGHRDVTMTKVIGQLLHAQHTCDAEQVYRIMAKSCHAADLDTDKLWDRCVHFAAEKQGQRDEAQRLQEAIDEACEDLPFVLVSGGSKCYHVLDVPTQRYEHPVAKDGLAHMLLTHVAPYYPGLEVTTEKGRPLPTNQLHINANAAYLKSVVYKMGQEGDIYDPKHSTLTIGCANLDRELKAKRHDDVLAWLTNLGGEHSETFLDWCATVTLLETPTCALYLDGTDGVGKSMFAAAVARMFGPSTTTYEQATGNWTAPLKDNPIVLADEGLPSKAQQFSQDLRSLVSERMRPLKQKFVSDGVIHGCPRLIITANNPDALRLINETLTSNDIGAISKRIFYLKCGMKRPTNTEGWVNGEKGEPGKICQTLLWLAQNRNVVPGKRFLVEGIRTSWHQGLTRASGITGDVLAVLAYFLERGKQHAGIVTGEESGHILVYPRTIKELWGTMLPNEAPPKDRLISKAVATISEGEPVKRRLPSNKQWRYYRVPIEQILSEADDRLIGSRENLIEAASRKHTAQGAQ